MALLTDFQVSMLPACAPCTELCQLLGTPGLAPSGPGQRIGCYTCVNTLSNCQTDLRQLLACGCGFEARRR